MTKQKIPTKNDKNNIHLPIRILQIGNIHTQIPTCTRASGSSGH